MDLLNLAEELRRHVEQLASKPRCPGTLNHEKARHYLCEQLQQFGFEVEIQHTDLEGIPCTNLLSKPLPDQQDLPLLILGAHYDTVPDSPGADDNASGVSALLEIARWIRPFLEKSTNPKVRLQLVAYDLEELGLVGSDLHCQLLRASKEKVLGMVSLEMLGYTDHAPGSQNFPNSLAHLYPDVGNFIGLIATETSRNLFDGISMGLQMIDGLLMETLTVPGSGKIMPVTRLSDHASFWDHGYPALMITDTSFFRNPHYHLKTDLPTTLDYPFLARVTNGLRLGTKHLLHD